MRVLALRCGGPWPPPSRGPTWPGRPERPRGQESWHFGRTRPPRHPPGAAALPRVPRQRGLEAVAMEQSQRELESRGLELRGRPGASEQGRQVDVARCRVGGVVEAHLSRVGVEALNEIDVAPDGRKGVTWAQASSPPIQVPGVSCGGRCSHLPSWAMRSSRECWKREASVGLCDPPQDGDSASWNRLPTSCGARGG